MLHTPTAKLSEVPPGAPSASDCDGWKSLGNREDSAANTARKRSALRECRRHILKYAWADDDEDGEPAPLSEFEASSWSSWRGNLHVAFDDNVVAYEVPAYAEIYGQHPRTFHFGPDGQKVSIVSPDPYSKSIHPHRESRELSTLICEPSALVSDSAPRRSTNVCRTYRRRSCRLFVSPTNSCNAVGSVSAPVTQSNRQHDDGICVRDWCGSSRAHSCNRDFALCDAARASPLETRPRSGSR